MNDALALIEENCRLRDKLLEIAGECAACDGTGTVDYLGATGCSVKQVPCPDCEDIREVLK